MRILRVKSTFIHSEIDHGKIHGQGSTKRYCFVLVETDCGNYFSELYPGTYASRLVDACIETIAERLCSEQIYQSINAIQSKLHIPFISGNGMYEACVSAVLNAIHSHFNDYTVNKLSDVKYYYSGGTVKSTLSEIEEEVDFAIKNQYEFYKVRLDYRNVEDCKSKIEVLNNINLPYCVDFIVNTNYSLNCSETILKITTLMDPAKVIWIEEPFVPSSMHYQRDFAAQLRTQGHKIALGESFTSLFELNSLIEAGLADYIQLDCTITSNISNLISFAAETKLAVAFHNWGSLITSLQNVIIAAQIGRTSYFEIPYYSTPFDRWLASVRDLSRSVLGLNESERECIFEHIKTNGKRTHEDFSWS
jgi:hypothetical protein